MAMTNAEKQARYRERKAEDGERLQAIISVHAKRSLERLARHHGTTQAAMLERLILDEQKRVTAGMDGHEYGEYLGESVTV